MAINQIDYAAEKLLVSTMTKTAVLDLATYVFSLNMLLKWTMIQVISFMWWLNVNINYDDNDYHLVKIDVDYMYNICNLFWVII